MRSKTLSKTTGRITPSTSPTKRPEPGSDEWMIEQGFHELTPEESRKYAKFFPSKKPFFIRAIRAIRHRFFPAS
jgi:hypothetical protein